MLEVYLLIVGIKKAIEALMIIKNSITISHAVIKLANMQQKPINIIPMMINCSLSIFSIHLNEIINMIVNAIKLRDIKSENATGLK